MTKVILNDTEFNRFARRSELDDLHYYLRAVAQKKRAGYAGDVETSLYLEDDMIVRLNAFAKSINNNPEFLTELAGFDLRAFGNGEYRLTLMYPTSKLTLAKNLFNTLANNKCRLSDLRGKQTSIRRVTNFYYEMDIEAISRSLPNGGIYNFAMLVYTLVHFNK